MSKPIAIAFSDLHLSLTAPACRAEKDWLNVQASYLQQLKHAAKKLSVPILFAGDLFDRWNPPPELITFALWHLPNDMICVPGQHDLPNHRLEDMHRSGYGVLVEAKKIRDISGTSTGNMGGFTVHGFGWGQPILPAAKSNMVRIALVHRYCWSSHFGDYPGAPQEHRLGSKILEKELKSYDFAVFGDNHAGFHAQCGDTIVVNCGGFILRKADEINRHPFLSVLFDNGTCEKWKLDTSEDRFHDVPEDKEELAVDVKAFIETLSKLGEHGLDFREAVKNHLRGEDVSPAAKQIILEALEAHESAN